LNVLFWSKKFNLGETSLKKYFKSLTDPQLLNGSVFPKRAEITLAVKITTKLTKSLAYQLFCLADLFHFSLLHVLPI